MKKSKRIIFGALLVAAVLIAIAFLSHMGVNPDVKLTNSEKALDYISQKHGVPKEMLMIANEKEANFPLTNQKIWSVNILNPQTGEVYYIDLDEAGNPVDIEAAKALERISYKEKYGKKEIALYEILQKMNPDDMVAKTEEVPAGDDLTSLEVGEVFNESGGNFTRKWDAKNFLGFWRDSETGDSTETLAINQSILNNKHRVIERHNLIYTTRAIPINYRIYRRTGKAPEGTQGLYQAIGWLGEKYVFFQGGRIAKVIFEQNATEEKELTTGESWELGEGYRLIVNSMSPRDSAGRQSWLTLFKDSKTLVDIIMAQSGNGNFFTYQMNVSDGIPNFMIYCSRVESLPYNDAAYYNYTWLRSQDITELREGQVYGIMEIISVNNGIIELRNKEPIDLAPKNIINLMGDLNIQVGRSTTDLEFYPFALKKGEKSTILTFETWSRGYRSNISGDRPYFKVITNYSDWNEFLDNQDPWYIRKKHAKLEGQLFPGLNIIPKNISPDDFNNYFIMAAMMGEQGGTGPEIEIKNISMSNNIVNVTVRLYIPSFGLSAQSYPYDIVIVKRELLPDRNSTFVFVSTEGKELEKLKVENK